LSSTHGYDASDLEDSKSDSAGLFAVTVKRLVSAASTKYGSVHNDDGDYHGITIALHWYKYWIVCDLQQTNPISCPFTILKAENAGELEPIYDHLKVALRRELAGWGISEESAGTTQILKQTSFLKDSQKVSLSIYQNEGSYFLNVNFYAPIE
jgi:hypothetical protein